MDVSVVIPLYNKASCIARALDSVFAQDVRASEVVVIDDGSTDSSSEVLSGYAQSRMRLIRQENQGECAARNRGIAESRSDLVAFLDADDEWLPGHLETIIRLASMYPECGAYATAWEMVDQRGHRRALRLNHMPKPPWEGVVPNYFRSTPVWSSAVAIPKRVFSSVGLFPVGVRRGGDLHMWCRVALRYRIAFSTHVGAVYHQEAENRASVQYPLPRPQDHILIRVIDTALGSGDIPPWVTSDDLVEYRNLKLIQLADSHTDAGDAARARTHLGEATRTRSHRLRWLRSWARTFVPMVVRTASHSVFERRGSRR